MAAKDIYHNTVKAALKKDRWIITDDPLTISAGQRDVFVDLAAEKLILAQKKSQKIAVEVKSFINPSLVKDLENALGQYILYDSLLKKQQSNRLLYLAIREEIYLDFFAEEIVKTVLDFQTINLLIFNAQKEEIVKWIN